MKNIATKGLIAMAIAAVLTVGTISTTFAQTKPILGKRQVRRTASPANQQIKAIVKQLKDAEKIMKSALPIYHGDRVTSMELNHLTMEELHEAMTQNNLNAAASRTTIQTKIAAIKPGKENPLKKYTADEINASNAKMQQALAVVQSAKAALAAVPTDAAGHIADANVSLDKTISEINLALQVVGSGGTGTIRP